MNLEEAVSELDRYWHEALPPSEIEVRDEEGYVRDPVQGHLRLGAKDFIIIDTPPFQRLRFVSQLGFVDRLYPGAHHTRFEHCLGAAHVAHKIMERLQRDPNARRVRKISDEDVWTVKIAAYLHDIGHLPFSHAIEPLFHQSMPVPTDDWSVHEQIGYSYFNTSYFAELFETMNSLFKDMRFDRDRIAVLAAGQKDQIENDSDLFMYEVIHGKPVDCDRLDYLMRDAYYCGVPHGEVDVDRLIETFTLVERDGQVHLAIDESGLLALEAMAVSRSTMYGAVYNHRTSRIAEGMILRALHYEDKLQAATLQSLVGATDGFVIELLKEGGEIAKSIVRGLVHRCFFKRVFYARLSSICNVKPTADYNPAKAKHGPAFAKANSYFKSWPQRVQFEEECSPDATGMMMIDCPELKFPKPPTPDEYTPVRFRDGSDRSIVETSPIVHVVEMERDFFATSILCAAGRSINKTKASEEVKRKFKQKFGLVIS